MTTPWSQYPRAPAKSPVFAGVTLSVFLKTYSFSIFFQYWYHIMVTDSQRVD